MRSSYRRYNAGLASTLVLATLMTALETGSEALSVPSVGSLESWTASYRMPGEPPFPDDNAWSAERAALGQRLFFDPRLSGSGILSCASCHNPGLAWGDGLPRAVGHGMKTLARRTPTILNTAWSSTLFWDGRATTLEEQALGPITSPAEMNLDAETLVARIAAVAEYRASFAKAYPERPLDAQTIAMAIATYERTVVSGRAPFDEWIEGRTDALSESASRGFLLFNTTARCAQCHGGWRFTDDSFHDIGLPGTDEGRATITGIPVNRFAFKTPTLRNVDRRAPYMHDGSIATLSDVIDHYADGGRIRRESLSPEMMPLELDAKDRADLLAFLESLTSIDAPVSIPALPR